MKIRAFKQSEISQIIAIIGRNYPARYKKIARRDFSAATSGYWKKPNYLVATINKNIVGFGGLNESWMDTDICELFWLNVRAPEQNRGIGTKIFKALLKLARQKKYQFALISTTRPRFYIKLGFKKLWDLRNHYRLMGLRLK